MVGATEALAVEMVVMGVQTAAAARAAVREGEVRAEGSEAAAMGVEEVVEKEEEEMEGALVVGMAEAVTVVAMAVEMEEVVMVAGWVGAMAEVAKEEVTVAVVMAAVRVEVEKVVG